MKVKNPLFLLPLTLVLLAPTLTQAFWEKLIKTATLDTKALAQLETFTSDATGSLEELNKSVHTMVKERRASICCYDVVKQEDKLSLSLRSALYTAIVALSRLQDATSEYRQQLNQKCGKCDVPPSEVLCNAQDYPCPSEPEKCITPFQQCDGTPDCIDASDEKVENCFKFPCDRGVMCEENQLCIPSSYRCDGRDDCPHGSDETTCRILFTDTPPTTTMAPTKPSITTFTSTSVTNELPLQCGDFQVRCESDSICIPAIWRCDGNIDCKDGSDEVSCDTSSPCRDDQFKCVSGDNCLPAEWRCDGEKDCMDGSDEASCTTTTVPITTPTPTTTQCANNQLRCESDGTCLPAIWRCDGDEDCNDGSDEASCTTTTTTTTTPATTCSYDQFKCVSNGRCVPARWRCDGEEDCVDGSDEASCITSNTTTTTPTSTTTQCDDYELRCESDGTCLPATWRCDGDEDCDDGSDEASCTTTTTTTTTPATTDCNETQFKCASGKCVPELWRCDGEKDCDDGSDEADCLESTTTATTKAEAPDAGCDSDQLKCTSSGDCLPGVFRCDGLRDCFDGSDEENCTTVKGEACEGNPCSHRCVSVPWANQGFLCTCPEGMELRVPDRHNCVPTGVKGFKGDISGTKGVKG